MSLSFLIRRATSADAEPISHVHTRSWQHAYRNLLPSEWLDNLQWQDRIGSWNRGLAEGSSTKVYVATNEEDEVIGFASAGASRDTDVDQLRTYELYSIYLVPEAWNIGVGAGLLQSVLEDISVEFESMSVWVLTGNQRARKYYERQGFGQDGAIQTAQIDVHQLEEIRYRIALPIQQGN